MTFELRLVISQNYILNKVFIKDSFLLCHLGTSTRVNFKKFSLSFATPSNLRNTSCKSLLYISSRRFIAAILPHSKLRTLKFHKPLQPKTGDVDILYGNSFY
jgi:hypothetical protein